MIMAAADLLNRNPNPTEEEVRKGLEGNSALQTGYQNIVRPWMAAAQAQARSRGMSATTTSQRLGSAIDQAGSRTRR